MYTIRRRGGRLLHGLHRPATLALLLQLVGGSASAHVGDRVFRIPELSDEDLPLIDLHDGSAADWQEVLGPPAIVLADFTAWGSSNPPTGLDLRVWVAWHADPARLYLAMERVDDIYTNDYHFTFNSPRHLEMYRWDSGFDFIVDGDHSGGNHFASGSQDEYHRTFNSTAQWYGAIAAIFDDHPQANRQLRTFAHGQQGINWYCDPPGSVASSFQAGRVIGLGIATGDFDGVSQTSLALPEDIRLWSFADGLVDAQLVAAAERVADGTPSQHRAVSWARTKATLSPDAAAKGGEARP